MPAPSASGRADDGLAAAAGPATVSHASAIPAANMAMTIGLTARMRNSMAMNSPF
jgi:hypothetical protein